MRLDLQMYTQTSTKTILHIGYVRVSSTQQNTARQLEGEKLSLTFTDKVSGASTQRPELQRLLEDTNLSLLHEVVLHVHSLDRLARNLQDLQMLIQKLAAKGWTVVFHKENLTFTAGAGAGSAMQTLLLQMLGAVAEFERSLIRERQAEGIAIAKQKKVYKGRAACLNAERINELQLRAKVQNNKTALAKEFGISRVSLYKYLSCCDFN
jgi:DNA invertase Pin-like site-specific DNA recombinase